MYSFTVSTVSADGLALLGAGPSAGTVMIQVWSSDDQIWVQ